MGKKSARGLSAKMDEVEFCEQTKLPEETVSLLHQAHTHTPVPSAALVPNPVLPCVLLENPEASRGTWELPLLQVALSCRLKVAGCDSPALLLRTNSEW